MIKKFYSNRARPGWKYDARLKKYYSWGFEMWLASGRRKRETGFLNRADVESVVARVRQLEKEMKYGLVLTVESPSLENACEKKLSLTANRREHVRAKRVLALLCKVVQVKRITELRTEHLQRFVDVLRKEVSPQTINRDLNIVSAMLHSAVIHFPALSDWAVPRVPRPKHSKRRRERIITTQEVAKVLTWLYSPQEQETERQAVNRRNVGHVFRMTLLTGARKGEICKMRWTHVDFEAGIVQVVGSKNENRSQQTARPVAIDRAIRMILKERQQEAKGKFVFTRNGGEVTHYYQILKRCSEACGVPYGRDVAGGFVTHDARHTAITRMLQAGVDLATIGSITGHQDRTMIMRYGHASVESQKRAMGVLENFAGIDALGDGLEMVSSDREISEESQQGLVPKGGRMRRKA